MVAIKIDPTTNEIVFSNGSFETVDGTDELEQRLRVGFKNITNDWFRNLDDGIPLFESVLLKNPDLATISSIFKNYILSDPEIDRLLQFELILENSTRKLNLTFEALSTFGTTVAIDTEIGAL